LAKFSPSFWRQRTIHLRECVTTRGASCRPAHPYYSTVRDEIVLRPVAAVVVAR
jgi:hypothetical protein